MPHFYEQFKRMLAWLVLLAFNCISIKAENYQYFLRGEASNASPKATEGGLLLAGGGGGVDDAYRWFFQKAGGGDIVILSATLENNPPITGSTPLAGVIRLKPSYS